MHSAVRSIAAILVAAAILSCGGGDGVTPPPPPPPVDHTAVSAITVTAPSTTLAAGKTMVLTAVATNAAGTVLTGKTFVWSTSSAAIATVEQNGTVLGVAPGPVNVAAAIGAKNHVVTLTITTPPPATAIEINSVNGQSATVNTPVPARPSVIVKDVSGDPVAGVTVAFAVTGGGGTVTGATAVTTAAGVATVGSWTMGPVAGAQTLTASSGVLAGSPVTFTATATALPSNLRQYNANALSGCTNPDLRTGRVEAERAHVTIVADLANPSGGFTPGDYELFADRFENLVWPVVTENFGVPSDIDGNGRVVVFFTSAVNSLTPPGSSSFVGGFFYGRDLLPKVMNPEIFNQDCPGSNETEMFYVLAPDPNGTLGLMHSTEFVRTLAVGVIGHEMQHLINFSRRLYINTNTNFETNDAFEDVFMEEGLSHIAEELLLYDAGSLTPRSNFTGAALTGAPNSAANSFARSNLQRFSGFLRDPSDNSPYANNDALATRGAIWSFLRYLADRGSAAASTDASCGSSVSLAVNATCRLEGSGAGSFSIAGEAGSEYTIVAFANDATLTTTASATNAVAAGGPPNPSLLPANAIWSQRWDGGIGARTLDMSFHQRLRATTMRELAPRLSRARARFGTASRGLARFSATQAPRRASFDAAVVEPVWMRLVNSGRAGMNNLALEFGQNVGDHAAIREAARDWAVANYADDAVPGMPSHYTHPSWNFRSAMSIPNVSGYAIQTRSLTATPSDVGMSSGGAAYYRLGVAASTTSTVTFLVNGAAPPANLKLVVIRTK